MQRCNVGEEPAQRGGRKLVIARVRPTKPLDLLKKSLDQIASAEGLNQEPRGDLNALMIAFTSKVGFGGEADISP